MTLESSCFLRSIASPIARAVSCSDLTVQTKSHALAVTQSAPQTMVAELGQLSDPLV